MQFINVVNVHVDNEVAVATVMDDIVSYKTSLIRDKLVLRDSPIRVSESRLLYRKIRRIPKFLMNFSK
jgi:hypothetical protein